MASIGWRARPTSCKTVTSCTSLPARSTTGHILLLLAFRADFEGRAVGVKRDRGLVLEALQLLSQFVRRNTRRPAADHTANRADRHCGWPGRKAEFDTAVDRSRQWLRTVKVETTEQTGAHDALLLTAGLRCSLIGYQAR